MTELAAIAFVLTLAALLALAIRRVHDRRAAQAVMARIREIEALVPPDELPRTRDLTPAERRRGRRRPRRHPLGRKRRTGEWG